MAKTSTWITDCKICKSPVYYYPAKLLLESNSFPDLSDEIQRRKRIVDCTCTGETNNEKHTRSYDFPKDFIKG